MTGTSGSIAGISPNSAAGWWNDQQLVVGEESVPRHLATSGATTITSGAMRLGFFTARKSETINNLTVTVGGVAAGATPTLVRWGIYEIAANGDGTLVAAIANDTAALAVIGTRYSRATLAPWAKVAGRRYAAGVLVVTGAATPQLAAWTTGAGYAWLASAPRITGVLAGQTDLPASFADAALTASGTHPYVEMLP